MTVVSPSEWDDFRAILKEHGCQEGDFELNEVEDRPDSPDPTPITGTLTISRKGNSMTQVYRVGHGSTWLADFHGDLARGAFG
jgi:hypothetical protein